MLLRKYQTGNQFILPADNAKSETTSIYNGPKQNLLKKEQQFKTFKKQALQQLDKQMQRGSINKDQYAKIKNKINSADNHLDLDKNLETAQQNLVRATNTPIIKNKPVYEDKEFTKEFFDKAKESKYIVDDVLPNAGRALTSLYTKGNLSDVPKSYELYKRYGVKMPNKGGYGDGVMAEDSGSQILEAFNPVRSLQDAIYNVQDKEFGKAALNTLGALPIFGLAKPTAGLVTKAGHLLKTAQPIATTGLPGRLATNALAVNKTVNLSGVALEGAGKSLRFGSDNALDIAGVGGSSTLKPKITYNKNTPEVIINPTIKTPTPLKDKFSQIAEGYVWNEDWMKHPVTQAKIREGFINPTDLILNEDLYLKHKPELPILDNRYNSNTKGAGGVYDHNTKEQFISHDLDKLDVDTKSPYALVTVHENRHAHDLDYGLLRASGAYTTLRGLIPERAKRAATNFAAAREKGKDAVNELYNKDKFMHDLGYISTPEEIAAHIQELRYSFRLRPDQEITPSMAQQMHNIVKNKKGFNVSAVMMDKHVLGSWDNVPLEQRPSNWKEVPNYKNVAKAFNKLYIAAPVAGATLLNK